MDHLCFYLFYLVMMSGVAYCFYNVFIFHHYASIFLHLCIIAVSIPHVLPLISKWSTCLFKREVNVIFKRAKALFMSFLSFCIGISRQSYSKCYFVRNQFKLAKFHSKIIFPHKDQCIIILFSVHIHAIFTQYLVFSVDICLQPCL